MPCLEHEGDSALYPRIYFYFNPSRSSRDDRAIEILITKSSSIITHAGDYVDTRTRVFFGYVDNFN